MVSLDEKTWRYSWYDTWFYHIYLLISYKSWNFLSLILFKSIKETNAISKAKQYQNITPNHILKKGLIENLDDFFEDKKKDLKKKRLVNSFKPKFSMAKQKSKTVIISSLNNSDKEDLLISTLILTLWADIENLYNDIYRCLLFSLTVKRG